jgi:hypothetical protein
MAAMCNEVNVQQGIVSQSSLGCSPDMVTASRSIREDESAAEVEREQAVFAFSQTESADV